MASGEIMIVYAYLDTLESKARGVASMLDGSSTMLNMNFPNNPEVNDVYEEFLGRWKKHRGELQDGANGLAEAFKGISDAFHKVEDVLVAALNGEG